MARRMTDTDKWNKVWYRKLPPALKLLWLYMCDRCDHAGIWEVDLEMAEHYIGAKLDPTKVAEAFSHQMLVINEKRWLIRDFIRFQYRCEPPELNPENHAHRGVLKVLEQYGVELAKIVVINGKGEPLVSPLVGAREPLPRGTGVGIGIGIGKESTRPVESTRDTEKKKVADSVWLSKAEFEDLFKRLGTRERVKRAIEILDNYKVSTGKKYKSDHRAILAWVIDRLKEEEAKRNGTRKAEGVSGIQVQRMLEQKREAKP